MYEVLEFLYCPYSDNITNSYVSKRLSNCIPGVDIDPLSFRDQSLDRGGVATLGRLQDLGRDGIVGPLVRRVVQREEESSGQRQRDGERAKLKV